MRKYVKELEEDIFKIIKTQADTSDSDWHSTNLKNGNKVIDGKHN